MQICMRVTTKDNRQAELCRYKPEYAGLLLDYLTGLSAETRSRFGPHPFTLEGIQDVFSLKPQVIGYLAVDPDTNRVVAYALVLTGCMENELQRYATYGSPICQAGACTFAPSVADAWQSSGLGSLMFEYILSDIRLQDFRTMVLWGGVQASNSRARNFYRKHGFIEVGEFEQNGFNIDMLLNPV